MLTNVYHTRKKKQLNSYLKSSSSKKHKSAQAETHIEKIYIHTIVNRNSLTSTPTTIQTRYFETLSIVIEAQRSGSQLSKR